MKSSVFRLSASGLIILALMTGAAMLGKAGVLPGSSLALAFEARYSPRPLPKSLREEIDPEEYAVYSALINAGTNDENKDRLLVIVREPSPWIGFIEEEHATFYDDLKKSSTLLMAETVEDLKAKNEEKQSFTRRFSLTRPYLLISEQEIEETFKEGAGGWEEFFRKYPQARGFTTYSRVGFNRDKTQALVYQGHSCGGLCGSGSYVLLLKENGVWIKKGSVGPVWVS